MLIQLFNFIRKLPVGRVPISLFLLKFGVVPKEKVHFKHKDGFELLLDLSDWVQLVIFLFGDYKYEKREVALWKKLATKSFNVLDIGAHIGYYSLLACSSGKNVKVLAVEPSLKTFAALNENIKANDYNIQPYYLAIGKEQGRATMKIADKNNSGMNYLDVANSNNEHSVELDTLDHFYSQKLNSKSVDLMKIDAEGSEFNILLGAQEFLESSKPIIFIELLNSTLNRFGADIQQVYELMQQLGYEFYYINENSEILRCTYGQEGEVLILIHPNKRKFINSVASIER